MKSYNLLQELHLIFQNIVSEQINKLLFMDFVFSALDIDPSYETDHGIFSCDNRTMYRYYAMENHLSHKACDYLAAIQSRPIEQLISRYQSDKSDIPGTLIKLQSQMHTLCQAHSISSDQCGDNFNQLFNLLIKKHMENDRPQKVSNAALLPSGYCVPFKKVSVSPCKNYAPHPSEEHIVQLLKQEHLLFLYSFPGTGKTELARSILGSHDNYGFKETAFITFTETITGTLDRIRFASSKKYGPVISVEQKLELLKRKDSSSLLIINKLPSSQKIINECFSLFQEMSLTVLITVDADSLTLPDEMAAYKLEDLPFENLKEIFEQSSGTSIPNEIAEEFFFQLEYHPLAIKLLGSVFPHNAADMESFFLHFPTTPVSSLNSLYVKYKSKKMHILTHLSSIVSLDGFLSPDEWDAVRSLSLFNGLQISRELLLLWFPHISGTLLDSLCQKGILIPDDSDHTNIRMHRIISEIVLYQLEFRNILAQDVTRRKSNTPSFLPLLLKIMETLTGCWNSSYDALQIQELSFAVFKTLEQHSIRFKTNKSQKHYSREGIFWLTYCFKCIHYYQEYGNTVYAGEILDKIQDSYSGISLPFFLKIEKEMNLIFEEWQSHKLDINKIPALLDNIQDYCSCSAPAEIKDYIPRILSILYRMITVYLDRLILCIKDDLYNPRYQHCLLQALPILTELLDSFDNLNYLQKRFFISIYSIWTQPLCDETVDNITDVLLEIAADRPTQLRLLCDAVYMKSHICRSSPTEQNLSGLKQLYRKASDLFSASQNLPSYIQQSYAVSSLYYVLCFPRDKHLLLDVIHELPILYQNMVRLSDITEYSNIRKAVLHAMESLNFFPDF